jgi:putative transposase
MPQSLSRVLIHMAFSTNDRVPFLTEPIRKELFPYFVGVLEKHNCQPIQIGGVEDHVHLLFALSRTLTIAQSVEHLKSGSSKWIKGKWSDAASFAWQQGYGSFSVGPRDIDGVVVYIRNQVEHHRKFTFKEEFREMLRENRTEWDERYVWD